MSRWYQVLVLKVTPLTLTVWVAMPSGEKRSECLSLDQRKTYDLSFVEVPYLERTDWFVEVELLLAHASRVNCVPRSSPLCTESLMGRTSVGTKAPAPPTFPVAPATVVVSATSLLLQVESWRGGALAPFRCAT